MLKTGYVEDNFVGFSISSIVKVFLLLKTFISILNFPSLLDLFLAVRLSGPYGEKPDRLSGNQIAGFTRKLDRKKIK